MWPQVVGLLLGVWLMAAPDVLGHVGPARTNAHIVGPLVATFACVAIWEATRAVRWLNVGLGAWLALAPWALRYSWPEAVHSTAVGLLLARLAYTPGGLRHRFGGGWAALWPGHEREAAT